MNQIEKAWELENHDGISIYSDISCFDGSRTQDMMEDFDEEYTPENPTINEPTLRSITMVPGEVNNWCLAVPWAFSCLCVSHTSGHFQQFTDIL
jgi:hypothetical protein